MPKVEYTKSKGLVQKTGSGFSVADVPVVEHVQTLSTGAAATISAHGTHLLTSTGACTVTLSAGSYAGQKKLIVFVSDGGDITLVGETDGAGADNDEALGIMNNAGEHILLMWIGDRWVTLSSTL
jgi:hypothetical protein